MNNQVEVNSKLQVKLDIQTQPLRSQTYFSSIKDARSRSEEIVLQRGWRLKICFDWPLEIIEPQIVT